ncbi:hypothetical protein Plhal304r1_c002g0006771 [Plasmopara halstedii]
MRFCCELVILLITCVATLPKASFAELNRPYSRCLGTANSHRLRSELFTNQVANSVKKPSLMRKFFDYITGGYYRLQQATRAFLNGANRVQKDRSHPLYPSTTRYTLRLSRS